MFVFMFIAPLSDVVDSEDESGDYMYYFSVWLGKRGLYFKSFSVGLMIVIVSFISSMNELIFLNLLLYIST